MTAEDDQQRRWRLMWLSSLQAFSDSETQGNRWLDPAERNPHFSFVECMCSYFDDADLSEEKAYQNRLAKGHVSADEVAAVADFHSLAERYESPTGEDWDADSILRDANWQKVVDAARQAQQRLLALLTDSAERAALTQPLRWDERNGAFHADLTDSRIVPGGKWVAEQQAKGFRTMLGGLRRRLFGSGDS